MALEVILGHAGFCFFGATMSVVTVWQGVCLCASALQRASSSVVVSAAGTKGMLHFSCR